MTIKMEVYEPATEITCGEHSFRVALCTKCNKDYGQKIGIWGTPEDLTDRHWICSCGEHNPMPYLAKIQKDK